MKRCDICACELNPDEEKRIIRDDMAVIIFNGFSPTSLSIDLQTGIDLAAVGRAFGMDSVEQHEAWTYQALLDDTDWILCNNCFSIAEQYFFYDISASFGERKSYTTSEGELIVAHDKSVLSSAPAKLVERYILGAKNIFDNRTAFLKKVNKFLHVAVFIFGVIAIFRLAGFVHSLSQEWWIYFLDFGAIAVGALSLLAVHMGIGIFYVWAGSVLNKHTAKTFLSTFKDSEFLKKIAYGVLFINSSSGEEFYDGLVDGLAGLHGAPRYLVAKNILATRWKRNRLMEENKSIQSAKNGMRIKFLFNRSSDELGVYVGSGEIVTASLGGLP